MVDAPERLWLSAPNDDHEHEFWFEPGDGGTEYVRADLLIGPCGYLHMPIGLAEDHWSLEFDPSEHPDEVASAPLYMIDPALSGAVAEREAEPVATLCTLGVGDGSGKLFVHGDYDSIKAAQAIIFQAKKAASELEALRKRVAELEGERDLAVQDLITIDGHDDKWAKLWRSTDRAEAAEARVAELEKAVKGKDVAFDAIIAAFAIAYLGCEPPSAVEIEVIELARTARRVREGGKVDG